MLLSKAAETERRGQVFGGTTELPGLPCCRLPQPGRGLTGELLRRWALPEQRAGNRHVPDATEMLRCKEGVPPLETPAPQSSLCHCRADSRRDRLRLQTRAVFLPVP